MLRSIRALKIWRGKIKVSITSFRCSHRSVGVGNKNGVLLGQIESVIQKEYVQKDPSDALSNRSRMTTNVLCDVYV